jgi:DNA mismatch repair protein MutL
MGYGELLEKGRYPMAALFVEVPGEDLDINVHPQKLEVRFARPQEVYGAVRHVVGEAIAHAPWLASTSSHAYSLPPEHLDESPQSAVELQQRSIAAEPRPRSMSGIGAIRSLFETRRHDLESISSPPPSVPSLPTAQGFFSSLDYVGQVRKTFLVCETESALVIVDQHAAHERILFEKLRQAHRQKAVPQQRLLFPIPIELTDEVAAVTSQPSVQQALAELGFEIELFGLRTLLLRSVPELLKNADPKPLLLDVLAGWLGEESAHLTEASYDKLFATMACHAALRGGDPILPEQARTLLNQLDGVDLRSHCPHGRPVLLNFPWSEIESRLGRT